MCWPSKKQRSNFDDSTANQSKSQPNASSNVNPSSSAPPQPPATETANNGVAAATKMAPKVAIVIYSMYGHIATSACLCLRMMHLTLILFRDPVAEAVKEGVESAGGKATIYQCACIPFRLNCHFLTYLRIPSSPHQRYRLALLSEFPKRCPQKFSPRYMRRRRKIIQSSQRRTSPISTRSSLACRRDMGTSLRSGRCVRLGFLLLRRSGGYFRWRVASLE